MSAPDFLDTNVLVYAYDSTDRLKQTRAQEILRKALNGGAVISTQVLGEFAVTFLHKLSPRVKPRELGAMLDALGPIRAIP